VQYRPYIIPFDKAWRWYSLTTPVPATVAVPTPSPTAMIRLPRTHDVMGVQADGSQPMPGDGFNPYGNSIDFGMQVQPLAGGPFNLTVSVKRIISFTEQILLTYTFAIVPLAPGSFFQNVVAFEGFTADAWEILVGSDLACDVTLWGYAGWGWSKRLARDPLAVVVTEPVFV